jgi:hypothetical protein
MNANKIKIVKTDLDQFVNVPINMQWDFMGNDDSIDTYQEEVLEQVIGPAADFEVARFSHKPFQNQDTAINYEFFFYDDTQPITANTVGNWDMTYLNNGFTAAEIYYYSKPFTKSFFKLDFYDTTDEKNQQIYLSIILPVQQGLTEAVDLSTANPPIVPPVNIKKPKMVLDYLGDKEGFFVYWLRSRDFIDINTFYVTAKFFDARLGVFKQMTNTKQDLIVPSKFTFDNGEYFYYRVDLDYTNKTYEVFSTSTNTRVGDTNTPIKWYEYVNP